MKNSYDNPTFEEQFQKDEDGCMAIGCLIFSLIAIALIITIVLL